MVRKQKELELKEIKEREEEDNAEGYITEDENYYEEEKEKNKQMFDSNKDEERSKIIS